MPRYQLRYVEGPNDRLKISHAHTVQAASFAEALASRTHWPIMESYDHRIACAQNPGTSLYYMEAWEAEELPDDAEAAQA